MESQPKQACYGYIRHSTIVGGKAEIMEQKEAIQAIWQKIIEEGEGSCETIEYYVDHDEPHYEIKLYRRPEGRKMAGRLRAGDIIIAHSFRTVFWSVQDALDVLESWSRINIRLICADDGFGSPMDTGSAEFQHILRGMKIAQAIEQAFISERSIIHRRRAIATGEPHGGKPPFGWSIIEITDPKTKKRHRRYIYDEKEIRIADEILRLFNEGHSTNDICDMLNERNDISQERLLQWKNRVTPHIVTDIIANAVKRKIWASRKYHQQKYFAQTNVRPTNCHAKYIFTPHGIKIRNPLYKPPEKANNPSTTEEAKHEQHQADQG